MAMPVLLTLGALAMICSDDNGQNGSIDVVNPILQVTKLLESGKDRGLRLSDGYFWVDSTLGPHLHPLVDAGKLQIGSVFKLTNYRWKLDPRTPVYCRLVCTVYLVELPPFDCLLIIFIYYKQNDYGR
jgi:hypothetical protein